MGGSVVGSSVSAGASVRPLALSRISVIAASSSVVRCSSETGGAVRGVEGSRERSTCASRSLCSESRTKVDTAARIRPFVVIGPSRAIAGPSRDKRRSVAARLLAMVRFSSSRSSL